MNKWEIEEIYMSYVIGKCILIFKCYIKYIV